MDIWEDKGGNRYYIYGISRHGDQIIVIVNDSDNYLYDQEDLKLFCHKLIARVWGSDVPTVADMLESK